MQARVVSLIAFDLLLSACGKKQEAEVASPPAVQVTSVTQNTIRRIVHGDGVLYPREQANVVPKITAPVQKFYVRRGDHVKQGQLVAVLENRDLVSAATEAKTGIEAGGIQFARNGRRNNSGSRGESENGLGGRPAVRATAPRKCWIAASNCLRRERWRAARWMNRGWPMSQAQSQYQAAEEHLKTLQGSRERRTVEERRRTGADRQGALRIPGSAGRLFPRRSAQSQASWRTVR